jgi:hypothetical protein
MTDKCPQFLPPCQSSVPRVGHDIDDHNPIQANHLLKVDVPSFVAVNVVHRKTKVGSVRVGFQDVSPVRVRSLGNGDMQKDRVGS